MPDEAEAYRLVVVGAGVAGALENRVYWCRYENAFGDSWETRNAWQPDQELHVRALGG